MHFCRSCFRTRNSNLHPCILTGKSRERLGRRSRTGKSTVLRLFCVPDEVGEIEPSAVQSSSLHPRERTRTTSDRVRSMTEVLSKRTFVSGRRSAPSCSRAMPPSLQEGRAVEQHFTKQGLINCGVISAFNARLGASEQRSRARSDRGMHSVRAAISP